MHRKNYLTSGEFAKLCGTTKVTLRHYKDIGLLSPAREGENGYLYYDAMQFYDFYAIAVFKQTGTRLCEIKDCMKRQNAGEILELLKKQEKRLEEEKRKLEQMEFMVKNSVNNMSLGFSDLFEEGTPQIVEFKKESLLAIPSEEFHLTQAEQENSDLALISVLKKCRSICEAHEIQTDYQLGAIMTKETFLSGEKEIHSIFMRTNKKQATAYHREKPSGSYLCLLHKGQWRLAEAYRQLAAFIKERNLMIRGDVYAYDLAGFMINGMEKNAMTLISVQVRPPES